MEKFDGALPDHQDKTEEHMVGVWLHELQDHANLIAELPDSDPSSYLRSAFYTGVTQGLNDNTKWAKELADYALDEGAVNKETATVAKMEGYSWGLKFRERLQKEDRQEYRQKMVRSLRDKLSKIAPWDDQTRKPL